MYAHDFEEVISPSADWRIDGLWSESDFPEISFWELLINAADISVNY